MVSFWYIRKKEKRRKGFSYGHNSVFRAVSSQSIEFSAAFPATDAVGEVARIYCRSSNERTLLHSSTLGPNPDRVRMLELVLCEAR